jgi:hypothetical protein
MAAARHPVNAYPLAWPAGVPRTSARRDAAFHDVIGSHASGNRRRTRKQVQPAYVFLIDELRRLGAVTPVISSDLPLKPDGFPYAEATCADPGVAVYWHMRVTRGAGPVLVPYSMPCDHYTRIADNLYAVGKTIESMRAIERYGAVRTAQVFAGFAALPPGPGEEAQPPKPWREVLGGTWPDGLERTDLLALAKARHRRAIEQEHPDAGGAGDSGRMADLNRAWDEAQAELAG